MYRPLQRDRRVSRRVPASISGQRRAPRVPGGAGGDSGALGDVLSGGPAEVDDGGGLDAARGDDEEGSLDAILVGAFAAGGDVVRVGGAGDDVVGAERAAGDGEPAGLGTTLGARRNRSRRARRGGTPGATREARRRGGVCGGDGGVENICHDRRRGRAAKISDGPPRALIGARRRRVVPSLGRLGSARDGR